MADAARPLVVGNWKMWGPRTALADIDAIAVAARAHPTVQVALCVPATLIEAAAARAPGLTIGAQDCHAEPEGAYTGGVSASLVREAGASIVLVGHSERRRLCGERDADIRVKLQAAEEAGLDRILCVGEPIEARAHAADHVRSQLIHALDGAAPEGLAIAYEPVWAIGAGMAAGTGTIAAMHGMIRGCLRAVFGLDHRAVPILYGGSVDTANAASLLSLDEVDGVLVGGASRDGRSFSSIIGAVADIVSANTIATAARRG